jgi:hypothetical protein
MYTSHTASRTGRGGQGHVVESVVTNFELVASDLLWSEQNFTNLVADCFEAEPIVARAESCVKNGAVKVINRQSGKNLPESLGLEGLKTGLQHNSMKYNHSPRTEPRLQDISAPRFGRLVNISLMMATKWTPSWAVASIL